MPVYNRLFIRQRPRDSSMPSSWISSIPGMRFLGCREDLSEFFLVVTVGHCLPPRIWNLVIVHQIVVVDMHITEFEDT